MLVDWWRWRAIPYFLDPVSFQYFSGMRGVTLFGTGTSFNGGFT